MSSDPRVHKPRLPKAYTDQQLAFLKGSLPEFERRSQGSIRGDAKKFALDRAQDFINRFGLPDEFMNVEEPESRFKEQIYNWFKNTVGRTRRKLEGRPRSQKKAAEKAASLANELGWPSSVPSNAPNTVLPYAHAESSAGSPVNPAQTLISPIQYGGLQPSSSSMSTALSTPTTSHATTTHAPGQASSHTAAHAAAHTNAHGPPPPHTPHTPHTAAHTVAHTAQHTAQHNPPPPPHSAQHNGPQQQQQQLSGSQQQLSSSQQQQQSAHQPHPAQTQHNLSTLSLGITKATMRESFSQHLDASTIANMIASYIAANPSPTPLTPIVDALFDAISADAGSGGAGGGGIGLGLGGGVGGAGSSTAGRSEPHRYLRLFIDASNYFPPSIVHAGVAGPMAGPRALQMQIRKYATWIPTAPPRPSSTASPAPAYAAASPTHTHAHAAGPASSSALPSLTALTSLASLSPLGTLQRTGGPASHSPHTSAHPHPHPHGQHPGTANNTHAHAHAAHTHAHSLSDEMQRIAMDRQRRKDHIQWARIHAAALELSMLSMGRVGEGDNSGYTYAMGRAFSEMMARDAVWEEDEVEWVAGIVVLRAVIRTALRGDRRQRDEYDELLRTYERRWKEIKDEARQQAVTEVLLSAKEDLARLDESLS